MRENLSETLRVRVTAPDAERLAQLAQRLPLRQSSLARELLLIGMKAVEQDPAALLRGGDARTFLESNLNRR